MECPKCASAMEVVNFQNVVIDRCTHCQGLWFDIGEAESLSRSLVKEWLDTGDPAVGRRFDSTDQVHCPRCKRLMENHFDVEQTQLLFEVCPDHGKFFDAGEFTVWVVERPR